MKRIIIFGLFFSVLSTYFAYSQEKKASISALDQVKQKLKEVNAFYSKNPDYEVRIRQLIYSNSMSKVPEEQFTGYFRHKKQEEHSMILGVETIQNDNWRVVIDSNSKTISLSKPQKTENVSFDALNKSMLMCNSAKIIDSNDFCIMDLYFNPDKYPMSHLKIKISNNRIILLEMWHSVEITEDNQKIYPHTIIEYSQYKENAKYKNSEFDTHDVIKQEGKKIIPIGRYKNYSFYDLRVQR